MLENQPTAPAPVETQSERMTAFAALYKTRIPHYEQALRDKLAAVGVDPEVQANQSLYEQGILDTEFLTELLKLLPPEVKQILKDNATVGTLNDLRQNGSEVQQAQVVAAIDQASQAVAKHLVPETKVA